MTEDIKQVWWEAQSLGDLAPLPALVRGRSIALFDRKAKHFGPWVPYLGSPGFLCHESFAECRNAMVKHRSLCLDTLREKARLTASEIEHIRSLPIAEFPDAPQVQAQPEPEAAEGEGEEGGVQEEVKQEEVKPEPTKRPSRRSNG